MKCPYCASTESKVTNSREAESGTRRRRECQSCYARFTTYERIQVAGLVVLKEDDRREEFNKEKLIEGIRKACTKRPISPKAIEKLVEEIEGELYGSGQWEVSSENIGEIVMERLRRLDRVAYIRYASVYRDFTDIESFERAVKDLREDETRLSLPRLGSKSAHRNIDAGSRKPTKYGNKTPMLKGQVNLSA
ncbi:MAG: transcriptional regulator NrdR [Dehalococcoidia bacterium]|mgnify:FL=1|nr:transcriptional regulator NrdR [Dehalococcoidia bacterium]